MVSLLREVHKYEYEHGRKGLVQGGRTQAAVCVEASAAQRCCSSSAEKESSTLRRLAAPASGSAAARDMACGGAGGLGGHEQVSRSRGTHGSIRPDASEREGE